MHALFFPLFFSIAAPADEPPVLGAHLPGSIVFDWDGKSVDGNAHTEAIVRVTFSFVRTTADGDEIQRSTVELDVSPGTTSVPMREACSGIPPGEWRLYVRLEDAAGARGPFSPYIRVRVLEQPLPAAPTGLRVNTP